MSKEAHRKNFKATLEGALEIAFVGHVYLANLSAQGRMRLALRALYGGAQHCSNVRYIRSTLHHFCYDKVGSSSCILVLARYLSRAFPLVKALTDSPLCTTSIENTSSKVKEALVPFPSILTLSSNQLELFVTLYYPRSLSVTPKGRPPSIHLPLSRVTTPKAIVQATTIQIPKATKQSPYDHIPKATSQQS